MMNEDNNSIPFLDNNRTLSPISLTSHQEELCRRLDNLNRKTVGGQLLSSMFTGALYIIREECRSNPDWMAQSAHSLREILYHYKYRKEWTDAINNYGSVMAQDKTIEANLWRLYGEFTNIAHHSIKVSKEEFHRLIREYEIFLLRILDRQIDVHSRINNFLSKELPNTEGL